MPTRPRWRRTTDSGDRAYFNDARPHQGIGQEIPNRPPAPSAVGETVEETPILGGLHHNYRLAA